MLAKSLPVLSALLLSLSYHALGHAIITPALGVSGTAARSDVTRPSNNAPCGNGVNVANAIGGSSAVQANGNSFTVTVTNFNGLDFSDHISSYTHLNLLFIQWQRRLDGDYRQLGRSIGDW